MRSRVIHLVNPKTDSLTTRPQYFNRALYSPLAGLLAVAAAVPAAEHTLAAIQDLMLGSDPYLVGRDVSFSDLHLAPIVAYFVQFQEGTRAMAKLPQLSRWWLAMQQRPSFTATAPKM